MSNQDMSGRSVSISQRMPTPFSEEQRALMPFKAITIRKSD